MQTFLDANRKRKILAVDDEPINLAIIGEVLAHDYEVALPLTAKRRWRCCPIARRIIRWCCLI